jgi:flagellar assembly protein FliH
LSSEEAKRQQPRIFKAPSVSSDIFVLPVHHLAGSVHVDVVGEARPFIPPRLGSGDDLIETGLFDGFGGSGPEIAFEEPAPPPPPDPSPEIIAAAEAKAAQIVAAAEAQAAQLAQIAHQEAAIVLDAARAEIAQMEQAAYAEGYRVSMAAARQDLHIQLEQAAALLDGAHDAKAVVLAEAEPEVIRLALAIAKRVIHREIATDPRIVVDTVRESLRRLGGRAVARVRVNPAELPALNEAWHELTNVAREIEFVPDDSVSPGGCLVESRQGDIDALVETQVAAVAAQFLDVADRGPDEADVALDGLEAVPAGADVAAEAQASQPVEA